MHSLLLTRTRCCRGSFSWSSFDIEGLLLEVVEVLELLSADGCWDDDRSPAKLASVDELGFPVVLPKLPRLILPILPPPMMVLSMD